MHVFFTTVVRGGPPDRSGELVKIDWKKKQVVKQVPLIPFDPDVMRLDPNPRGNSRGGRGVVLVDDHLVAATYHSLHTYDLDLNFQGKISHSLFVNLHELTHDEGMILVSSTAIDAVIGVDKSGVFRKSWWPRQNVSLQRDLAISPLCIDEYADHREAYIDGTHMKDPGHLHLNAVAVNNNQIYCLLNRYGILYNASEDKIVIKDPSICGCHNLLFKDGYVFINNTKRQKLMVYREDGSLERTIDLLSFPEVAEIYRRARKNWLACQLTRIREGNLASPVFVRGLFPLQTSRVLISFSPATILEIDYERGKLLDLYKYSDDVRVTPHGLLAVESLEEDSSLFEH